MGVVGTPFVIYIDEFHRFLTPSLTALLSGARKFGVGQAICLVAGAGGASSLLVDAPVRLDSTAANARRGEVSQASRARHATDRAEVESIIAAAWSSSLGTESGSADAPATTHTVDAGEAEPPRSPQPDLAREPTGPSEAERGRGGRRHKDLQRTIKQLGEASGYRATIEAELPDGGRVDVLLERGSERIAVAVSVTTDVEHELGNVEKCLGAGCQRVLVVCARPAHRSALTDAIEARAKEPGWRDVAVVDVDGIAELLSPLPVPRQRTVRGYSVNTRVARSDEPATEGKEAAVARAIAEALRRFRRGREAGPDDSVGRS